MVVDQSLAAEALDEECDPDRGFIGKLRRSEFDPEGGRRVLGLIADVELTPGQEVDARIAWYLAYIPTLVYKQWGLVTREQREQLDHFADEYLDVCIDVVGVP